MTDNSSTTDLPPPSPDQGYVTISAIPGGFITLPDKFFVSPADPEAKRTVPSLSFLVTHPGPQIPCFEQLPDSPVQQEPSDFSRTVYRILFDLGLRSHVSRYPPAQQSHLENRRPYALEPGVAAQLAAGGTQASDIDAVILSHVHYDHHGDPEDFPQSTFVVGNGALDVLEHGLQGQASHQNFEKDLFAKNRVVELHCPPSRAGGSAMSSRTYTNADWKPLGPFDAVLDVFDDGSCFIIDTPGHLPGHVNLLCRTAKDKWVCLCGDSFHDIRLLTGEKEIGEWTTDQGACTCIHLDKSVAEDSIRRLQRLKKSEGTRVEMICAHDEMWLEVHPEKIFPGQF